jgi:hypothetical protein
LRRAPRQDLGFSTKELIVAQRQSKTATKKNCFQIAQAGRIMMSLSAATQTLIVAALLIQIVVPYAQRRFIKLPSGAAVPLLRPFAARAHSSARRFV